MKRRGVRINEGLATPVEKNNTWGVEISGGGLENGKNLRFMSINQALMAVKYEERKELVMDRKSCCKFLFQACFRDFSTKNLLCVGPNESGGWRISNK